MSLLTLDGVTKRFAGLTAVEDVSFSVARGEIVGLIGPNGAGKSTMLNLITGLSVPSEGHIAIERDGTARSLVGLKPHQIARLGVGRSFQHIRLFDDMSVLENVMVGLDAHLRAGYLASLFDMPAVKREEAEAREQAAALLAQVEPALAVMQSRRAGDLAYADRRRVEIARALATRPVLLLLDEPAAGMAPQEIDRLARDLQRIRAGGTSILLIEHKMRLIERATDRVVVLNHGRKLFEGTFDALAQDQSVVDAYLGRSYADSVATQR